MDADYADLRALAEALPHGDALDVPSSALWGWWNATRERLPALLADLEAAERSNAAMEQHVVNLNQRLDEETARRVAAQAEIERDTRLIAAMTEARDNARLQRATLATKVEEMRARVADEIEAYRRSMPDEVMAYHGASRCLDDMSWVLAQARDRVKTGDWSGPSW